MKLILIALTVLGAGLAHADESSGAKADDAKRGLEKTGHKIKEAVACAQGDVKCAKMKAKDRLKEGVQYGKDKVNEADKK